MSGEVLIPYVHSVQHFLKETKCSTPLFPTLGGRIIAIPSTATFLNAFQNLLANGLLSVPVLDNQMHVLGTFSMKDVMNVIVSYFQEHEMDNVKNREQMFELIVSKGLDSKTIADIPEVGKLEPPVLVQPSQPLSDALEKIVTTRTQRVIVVDAEGKLQNVITQSRIVAILGTVLETIPTASKTLQELNLGLKSVLCVPHNISTFQAFKFMKEKNASAVGVEENGVLVGNLSVNDLKLLGYSLEYFSLLSLPVKQYLQEIYSPKHQGKRLRARIVQSVPQNQPPPAVLACSPHDTLGYVIKMLYLHRVHRYYIVDEKQKPIGVVSLHDILKHIYESCISQAK